jgi:hypothetical protein
VVEDFSMPVDVVLNGENVRLNASDVWKSMGVGEDEKHKLTIDPDFYASSFNLLGK